MVIIIDSASGMRASEMESQIYADEVLLASWTDVPRLAAVGEPPVALRLVEVETGRVGVSKPSPLADPDFIARVYRAQR